MIDHTEFSTFLRRIRSGDAAAAEELVRRHERAVRVVVRIRLTDPALRRQFDSLDVCQSVFASFFVRAAAGQFDLREPRDLVALLARMAEYKLHHRVAHHYRQRRDFRRTAANADLESVRAAAPGPDQCAAGRDLLESLRSRLTPEERELADRRTAGLTWPEIATELGGTAQARRRQLNRAVNRVAPLIGIEELYNDHA